MTGMLRVYEPPASRFAGRVPLLLTQKGEVAVASRFPGSSGWTLRLMGSRLRGNDEGAAGVTVVSQRSLYGGGKCGEGEGASPPLGPGHPLRSLRSRVPLASRRGGFGSGLFEEVGDFGEEGWEFLLDDFPDFLVSDFGVSVD